MERVCERCAGEDDDLVMVRSGTEGPGPDGRGESELWCFECRSTAEHVAVDDG